MEIINQLDLASAFVFPRTGDSFKMIFVVVAVVAVLAVIVCLLLPKFTKKKPSDDASVTQEGFHDPEDSVEDIGNDVGAGTENTESSDDNLSDK
ncbi:MAG: hypothetical protein ACOYKJ_05375 [Candidatus Howiella sp.]